MRWLACLIAGCLTATAVAADRNPRQSFRRLDYLIPKAVTEQDGMGAWLLRLVDQYRVEGMGAAPAVEPFAVKGNGDCVPVGRGPGVHCILNIHWIDQFEIIMDPDVGPPGVYNVPGGVSYLNPSMMLVGLEPPRDGMQFLLVDNKGLPEGGGATIAGNRATLRSACVNAPKLFLDMNPDRKFEGRFPDTCERVMRIDAKLDSSVVHVDIDIEINREPVSRFQLTLRREKKHDRR
jgi:hypothetical protein